MDAKRVRKVHRGFARYLVPERHTQASLFIHMSDYRAKHFPRPLYQTRYGDFCFARRVGPLAKGRVRATVRLFEGINLPKWNTGKESGEAHRDLRLGFSESEVKGPLG